MKNSKVILHITDVHFSSETTHESDARTLALGQLVQTIDDLPDDWHPSIVCLTGGENVFSGEVEAVIYAHPAVLEAAVFGIPDPQWGELVMACVVLKPGNTLTIDDLIAHCRRTLANYKSPRRIEFSETELPKSGSGKILKRILRERFWAHQERTVG
jgi:AMP-binding enzyme C-terminal domain